MRVVRLSISHTQSTAERIGSHGMSGTRNDARMSGRFLRSTITPMLTSTNAESVPMLIISSSTPTSVKPARAATTTPAMICTRTGVRRLALVRLRPRGSRPSRLIAKTTRARPRSSTMSTVVRPSSVPMEITCAAHPAPTAVKAVVSDGSSASASTVYGTMPVRTRVTST